VVQVLRPQIVGATYPQRWKAGANQGTFLSWSDAFSTATLNSLGSGNAVLSDVTITNGAALDLYIDVSIALASAAFTGTNPSIQFFLYPQNQDAVTYGDGRFTTAAAGPVSPNYWVGTIPLVPLTQAQSGLAAGIVIPPGTFKLVLYNGGNVALASSGNTCQIRSYVRQIGDVGAFIWPGSAVLPGAGSMFAYSSGWTPASLSSTVLSAWYDFSDLSTITSAGGLITQINDKSGNGNHLTAAGASRPTTGANTLNGFNVSDFNGANVLNRGSASAGFASANPGGTTVAMRLVTSGTGAGFVWISSQGGSFGDNMTLGRDGGNTGAWGDSTSTSVGLAAQYADADNTNWHLNVGTHTSASRSVYADGTLQNTNNTSGLAFNTPDGIFVGQCLSQNRAANRFLTGRMAQVLVLSVISTTTRQLIEGWCLWKYGLQANLPPGHPYANFPP
jgi:hypothetical protein